MNELAVGQKFTKDNLREITKIDNGEIYYKTEKGIEKHCWIATFQDWIKKCKKSNSYNPTIEVTKRASDYHACIKNKKDLWGCGKNICESIGSLIMNHPENFDIEIIEK